MVKVRSGVETEKDNMINKLFSLLTLVFGFGPDVVTVTSGTAGNAGSTAAELITSCKMWVIQT